jgi:hypothetical protein
MCRASSSSCLPALHSYLTQHNLLWRALYKITYVFPEVPDLTNVRILHVSYAAPLHARLAAMIFSSRSHVTQLGPI